MSNFLPYLLTGLEYLGLIALALFNLAAWLTVTFIALVFSHDDPRPRNGERLGWLLLVCLLGVQAASVWCLCVGQLGVALFWGGLALPVGLVMYMPLCRLPFGITKGVIGFFTKPRHQASYPISTAMKNPMLPSIDASIPPTNLPTNAELVTDAEKLPKGSLANEQLIHDTLIPAYTAASAKQNTKIPLDTMVEPYLAKEPEGRQGRKTWEEIWVFQTRPKTSVRITFTEDGAGGANFSIKAN